MKLVIHNAARVWGGNEKWLLTLATGLAARAHEVAKSGRTGLYDIEVVNQNDKRVALFRGRSYRLNGTVLGGIEKK